MDLCGPMSEESLGGNRYFYLIVDDYSRWCTVFFIKNKSEAFTKFQRFHASVERQFGVKLKGVRSDRGGEFSSKEFEDYCSKYGIRREFTAPYTPQQNGVVERKNRTVVEMARGLLKSGGLPVKFWGEAVATAVHLINRSPTQALHNKTPYEAWLGTKPSVSYLRVFGCIAFALIPSLKLQKLDDKSMKCVFIGYSPESKAYKLYNPATCRVIISRDVVFHEDSRWNWGNITHEDHRFVIGEANEDLNDARIDCTGAGDPLIRSQNNVDAQEEETPPRKTRTLEDIYSTCTFALCAGTPTNFREAVMHKGWHEAMNTELASIEKNRTWELCELPSGKHAVGLKWIYKPKLNAQGEVVKLKARLVAKGYSQQHGVDYDEVFSPVARLETVRLVLALAAQAGWPVYHFDVKSAFLNGDIQEEVYVVQPEGYEIKGSENQVYRLKKALYGLKQAPRAWYSRIDQHFHDHGFIRSEFEHTLYRKVLENGDSLLLSLYVDDIVYTSSSNALIDQFKTDMMNTFDMSDLGELSFFLGLEIKQEANGTFIRQKSYIDLILQQHNMTSCKPVLTPMAVSEKTYRNTDAELTDPVMYRSLIGRLLYVTHSRPDVCFAVSYLSRFMNSPCKEHYIAAKRILRYLAGTRECGLWFSRDSCGTLEAFSDSDWGGSMPDRKSTTGMIIRLGLSAISWSSRKQEVVALSTTEAEYIAATATACQVVWLRRLLQECGHIFSSSTCLWCDNLSAIAVAKNPAHHGRTKHIDVRYHFIRGLVSDGVISLEHCSTNDQLADLFTKPLPPEKHAMMRSLIGVCELQSRGSVERLIEGKNVSAGVAGSCQEWLQGDGTNGEEKNVGSLSLNP